MLAEIFGLYLQGLLLSAVTVVLLAGAWLAYRAHKKLDETAQARQQTLYEALLMCLISFPILAFAFMAILLMLKA